MDNWGEINFEGEFFFNLHNQFFLEIYVWYSKNNEKIDENISGKYSRYITSVSLKFELHIKANYLNISLDKISVLAPIYLVHEKFAILNHNLPKKSWQRHKAQLHFICGSIFYETDVTFIQIGVLFMK